MTLELLKFQRFKTYLMFIPSSNPYGDDSCVWVTFKTVEWDWGVGLTQVKDCPRDPPCDKSTYIPFLERYPSPDGYDSFYYPEWDCNVQDNKRQRIYQQEQLEAANNRLRKHME